MRKVMDGYLAGPAGEIDWIESVDTILFGRVTYQLMAGYWPSASATEDDPRMGLIDDYRIFVAPIALGWGKPMFAGLDARIALRRVEVKSFRTGVVMLRYEPK